MPEVKFKLSESGAVAEDIFNDPELALNSKCVSVERTVQKGILTVDKALDAYKVPKSAYYSYLAKKHLDGITNETNSDSEKERVISTIGTIESMLTMSLNFIDPVTIGSITKLLSNISKDVEEDKVTFNK